MLPKGPVSCLAVLAIPVALVLLVVVLGGYLLKFLSSSDSSSSAPVVNTTSTQVTEQTPGPSFASRLPSTISATTTFLVATVSSDVAKEELYSVDAAGQATRMEVPQGFRPEQWKTAGITLMPPLESVTGSPWRVTGENWNVPLRTRSGSVWQDPVILGLFSSGRLAVVAYRNQRALLSVSKAGDIQVVEVLDDTLSPLTAEGSFAWFVRAPQLADVSLEALPQGPSELVRISERGTSSTVAQDPGLILELVPGPKGSSLAYLSSDGSLVILKGDKLHTPLKGVRPQVWLDDRYLLVSDGTGLGWVDSEEPKRVGFITEFKQFIRGATVSTASLPPVVN